MPEILPDESDQNFLYQLICSQLENDGYIKSAKCLQVELNSMVAHFTPGDKLEKLVNMCIQIKKHIDVHFNNPLNSRIENGDVAREAVGLGSMDADSTNKSPTTSPHLSVSPQFQPNSLSRELDITRSPNLAVSLSPAPTPGSDNESPMETETDENRPTSSHQLHTSIIQTSDATSSSEVLRRSPPDKTVAKAGLDSDLLKQQLLNQHFILQQIHMQQQHLQNSNLHEQTKQLSEYMLNCYKSDFSMLRENNGNATANCLSANLLNRPDLLLSAASLRKSLNLASNSTSPDLGLGTSQGSPTTPTFPSPVTSQSGKASPKSLTPDKDTATSSPSVGTVDQKPIVDTVKPYSRAADTPADLDRKRFPCQYCGRRFTQQSALQVHERTHTGEKPYHCHYCDKAFTQISNLKCHERLHTGEKPYRCQLCGKRFTQSASLRCHMRSHTGERPYLCKYCNKRFTQPASLQHHIRIHTGEKPYKCEHCGKSFTQPSSLVVHRRLHTGERPFVCQICNKSYTQAMPLKEHMRTHHMGHNINGQPDKSPLSFNIGQPFSIQMNQFQNSLTANLPFLLSNKFIPNLSTSLASSVTSRENPVFTPISSPTTSMSQLLFNRQNTAFQSVFPTVKKEHEQDNQQPNNL